MFELRYLDRGRHLKRREVKSRAGGVNPARLFCSTYAAGKEVTYWWQYCMGISLKEKLSNYLLVAVLQAMLAVCRGIIMNEKIM